MIDPFPRSENENKLPKRSLVNPIRHYRINRQYDKIMLYIKLLICNELLMACFLSKKGRWEKADSN